MKKAFSILLCFTLPVMLLGQVNFSIPDSMIQTSSGLQYTILKRGSGPKAKGGDVIYTHYLGMLEDSSVFEDTFQKGYPLIFTLGVGQVIKAWEEGFTYFHEGDKVFMIVPPEIGYGNNSYYNIPPNSRLYFFLEVVHVIPGRIIQPYDTEGVDTLIHTSGFQYLIIEEGKGTTPNEKELCVVEYTGFLESGKIFDSSRKKEKPFKFTMGADQVLKPWEDGLMKIAEGGKIKLIIPPELAYGEAGFKNIVPPDETITFDIELLEVKPEIIIEPYKTNGLEKIQSSSGLEYFIIEEGEGAEADTNSIVSVHYSGYFEDGTLFDSSVKRDEPIQFPLGIGAVIKGWDEALLNFREGTKAKLLIPYELGYGEEGNPPVIPGKANLVFDIELIKVM